MANSNPKPPNAGKGRPKGSANKTSTALKEAILQAAELVGEDGEGKDGLRGYLVNVAKKDMRTFGGLLGKVLPHTIVGDPNQPVGLEHSASDTLLEIMRSMRERTGEG